MFLQTALTTLQNPDLLSVTRRIWAELDLGSLCKLFCVLMEIHAGKKLHLLTTPFICGPLTPQQVALCAALYAHLSNLELAESADHDPLNDVDLLLGADYHWELATSRVEREVDGPIAVETKLGWVFSGPAPMASDISTHELLAVHTLTMNAQDKNLNDFSHAFWELASMGVFATTDVVLEEFVWSLWSVRARRQQKHLKDHLALRRHFVCYHAMRLKEISAC